MKTVHQGTVPNTHEMVVIHRMFRREFALLPDLVAGVAHGDTARARIVADHAAETMERLHRHHTGEDEMIWPRLLERDAADAGLVHRMEHQHEQVAAAIEELSGLLPAWRTNADGDTGATVAEVLSRLNEGLRVHLGEEEDNVLPLVREYITVEEWDGLGRHGIAELSRSQLVNQLGGILEEASDEEAQLFYAKMPRIARVMWGIFGRRRYERHIATVRGH